MTENVTGQVVAHLFPRLSNTGVSKYINMKFISKYPCCQKYECLDIHKDIDHRAARVYRALRGRTGCSMVWF
jgi:hypothetical protein